MQVGIIAPVKLVKKYCVTKTHYCLPYLLSTESTYRKFYQEKAKEGCKVYIDCRKPHWKREPEDLELCREASIHLPKSIVYILPSYMYNLKATLEVTKEYLVSLPGFEVVGVLEGTSEKEVLECKLQLEKLGISKFALPSYLYRLTNLEVEVYIENHLHIEELRHTSGVIFTSLPIRLGLQGRLLSDFKPSPPSLTFKEEQDQYSEITKQNVRETIRFYQ